MVSWFVKTDFSALMVNPPRTVLLFVDPEEYNQLLGLRPSGLEFRILCLEDSVIYGIRRSLIVIGSITEVRRRRARFIIGWVTAW